MTTSVKAACTGRLRAAAAANPFGIVAVVLVIFLLARPKWSSARVPVAAFVAAGALSWAWELHRFHWV